MFGRHGRNIFFTHTEPTGAPPAAPTPPPVPPTPPTPAPTTTAPDPAAPDPAALAAAAAQAAADTEARIAAELGVTPAEARAIVEQHQAQQQAQMTDAQRAHAAAEAARAAAAADRAEAGRVLRETHARSALVANGVTDPAVQDDLIRLVDIPATTPADQLPALAQAKVAELKTRHPGMFAAPTPAPAGPPSTTPAAAPVTPPAGGAQGVDAMEAGRQIARERYKGRNIGESNPFA